MTTNGVRAVSVEVEIADRALRGRVIELLESANLNVLPPGAPAADVTVGELGGDGSRQAAGHLVVISESADSSVTRRAMAGGADGIVVDAALERSLAPTVQAVAAGQVCVPREQRSSIQRQPLSYRERQALGMVVMGFSNGEIAGRLFLAESTVKSHLSSAFRKLGVRSRAEATALVLDPNEGVGVGILTIPESDGRHRVAATAKG
jgi:DNA-binding CsgD family transcriptional regulator